MIVADSPRSKKPKSRILEYDCLVSLHIRASVVRIGFCWQLTTGDCQLTYSLLIPCFCAWESRKPAIHAAFHARRKKFPVIFPVKQEIRAIA